MNLQRKRLASDYSIEIISFIIKCCKLFVKKYERQVSHMNKSIHTVHNKNGWQNKFEKVPKAIDTYLTKQDAQRAGRLIAKQNNSEHVIHGLNGKIQSKNSYGNDLYPPRG